MAFIAKKMVKSYAFRKETELVNTFFQNVFLIRQPVQKFFLVFTLNLHIKS